MLTNTEDMNRLVKYILFLSAAIINAFFENWLGQKIIDSSEKLYEYAYV